MDMRQLVGINVLRIRQGKRLSQEELGARSGFNQHYISELEAGKRNPTITSLQMLAEGLGVSSEELVRPIAGQRLKASKR
jgi:transcriptional regulator with XRE-family HTH domain